MDLSAEELNLTIEYLCQDFGGDWLLLGGSLIRFDVDPKRGTHDIDLLRLDSDSVSERTRLISEMKKRNISPEQLNSAVDFFVKQIPTWEQNLVLLKRGARGRIFRPNLTLFAILKLMRGTPIDLQDVKLAAQKWGFEEFDLAKFKSWASLREMQLAEKISLI